MKRIITLVLVATLAGCVTPVIPLPPPDPATMTFSVTGPGNSQVVIRASGMPNHQGNYIFIVNLRTGRGTITQTSDTDGSFVAEPMDAQNNDRLDIWAARGPDEITSDVICSMLDFASGRLARCPSP